MSTNNILIGIIVALMITIVWLELRRGKKPDESLIHQRLDSLNQQVLTQMQSFQTLVQTQMQEHRQTLNQTNQNIGSRLDQAAQLFGNVQQKLTSLEEGSKRIFEVGKDISSLQDILKTPKLRGSLGELFLGDMLAQIFTKNQYSLQYTFKSGEKVDAVVKLNDGLLVPIDAKFPLENFKRMQSDDEADKEVSRKVFKSDVKKHIDSIAAKYILPNEGTFDFALMYIPAENVYYEVILKDDSEAGLLPYAFQKRVIPVSPNTLYIYLQSILLGLKGMKVEEEAMNILKHLQTLSTEFGKFGKDYALVGSHLQNAQTKFNDTERQIGKINAQLSTIQDQTPVALSSTTEATSNDE